MPLLPPKSLRDAATPRATAPAPRPPVGLRRPCSPVVQRLDGYAEQFGKLDLRKPQPRSRGGHGVFPFRLLPVLILFRIKPAAVNLSILRRASRSTRPKAR